MKITVSGASGFLGRKLVPKLESAGHTVHQLGRAPRPGLSPAAGFSVWDPEAGLPPAESLTGADAVIHLAGEPVAQRWTPEAKRRIRSSRVEGTARLVEGLVGLSERPRVLVSASAVGYYGDRGDEILDEASGPGQGFLPELAAAWEAAALGARDLGVRVVVVRIGVVLGEGGGALAKMLTPFRAGVGGPLGNGRQWMSWIHSDDLVNLLVFAVESDRLSGAVNGVGPQPVRNSEFSAALGRALRRPALIRAPEFAIRLLFGEMADILFHSQRVVPKVAEAAGFVFRYPEVFGALKAAVEG